MSNEEYMAGLSDRDLEKYLTDPQQHTGSEIREAAEELRKRGRTVSPEELEKAMQMAKNEEENRPRESTGSFSPLNWRANLVNDPAAPELFTPAAILGFSALVNILFGAAMFAMNAEAVGKRKGMLVSLVFGAVYFFLEMLLLFNLERASSGLTLLMNGGGALIINYFFWNRYIGPQTLFRRRAIWPMLLIALVFAAGVMVLLLRASGVI